MAETILDNVNQASIWQFNSLGASDSFIAKTRHASLIERLEAASAEADKLRDTATKLVGTLRDEKRKLTKSIGSGANSPAMKIAEQSAEVAAEANMKAVKAKAGPTKPTAKKKAQAEASV
ncbi:MAG: hypothetical protein H0U18_02650 [Pyrinomonadaceae bacterium]|nr:hypothetical protein [Pyrinomonadaceae bacterium]